MIRLVITEPCKGCPWQQIRLTDTGLEPIAMCIHQSVCKYIGDSEAAQNQRMDYALCGDKTAQNAK